VLKVYDTRTRQVAAVGSGRRGELRMYTCGPAVDRRAHVGDLRPYLLSDLIRRAAERGGAMVTVCRDIADIGAAQAARQHGDAFRADLAALNVRPAEHSPRASVSIGLIIDVIAALIGSGHAYPAAGGSVFFDARSFPGYGELSGPGPHADWALWNGGAGRDGFSWPSPWGDGFPGWHAACSALSLHHLGDRIDVHIGGIDLRFPHHENVRAQSDALTGHEVVRRWVHAERVLFEGRAMAAPAGNVVLADLAARGLDPLALRVAFLEHRYRQRLDLGWDALETADKTLRRWRERVADWARSPSGVMPRDHVAAVVASFEDDLDTPAALAALRALERDESVPPGARFEAFAYLDQLLGLDLARDVGKP